MRISLQPIFVSLGLFALAAYFMHSAIAGKYGLEAQTKLMERSAELSGKIRSLEAVRAKLQRHVNLLTPEPPAADMVEEIARRDLGYAYRGETIISIR